MEELAQPSTAASLVTSSEGPSMAATTALPSDPLRSRRRPSPAAYAVTVYTRDPRGANGTEAAGRRERARVVLYIHCSLDGGGTWWAQPLVHVKGQDGVALLAAHLVPPRSLQRRMERGGPSGRTSGSTSGGTSLRQEVSPWLQGAGKLSVLVSTQPDVSPSNASLATPHGTNTEYMV